jgi:hypothetical protein
MKTFRFHFLLLCAASAIASPIAYTVTVDTSSVPRTQGSLDFNFNPGPLVTRSASLQILNFTSDGFLAGDCPCGMGDVDGQLPAILTFDNGTGFNDYFDDFVFGSTISFQVSLYGPALSSPDGISTSGSTFAFSMFSDSAGTIPTLTADTSNGFAFTIDVNLDGSTTVTNWSAQTMAVQEPSSVVPEPGTLSLILLAAGFCSVYGFRRIARAPALGKDASNRLMSATSFLVAVLFLISVSPQAEAQSAPVYVYMWGASWGAGENMTGAPGGSLCVASTPIPVTPKLRATPLPGPCAVGATFSQSTPVSVVVGSSGPLAQGNVSGQGTANSVSSSATISLSQFMMPAAVTTTSAMYLDNIPSKVTPGNQLTLQFQAAAAGNVFVNIVAASDDNLVQTPSSTSFARNGTITLPPLTIGPSGQYSLEILVEATGTLNYSAPNTFPSSAITVTTCLVNVRLSIAPASQEMQANFGAPTRENLKAYAAACHFDHFNWQQSVEVLPSPSPFFPIAPALNLSNVSANGSLTAPPGFSDPPPGDYTYDAATPILKSFPFFYPAAFLAPGAFCTVPLGASVCNPGHPYIVSTDGLTLSLVDGPTDPFLAGVPAATNPPAGTFVAFLSQLVGVDLMGNATPLFSWTWNSTFNGTSGGASQTRSLGPVDPGSGTGGVTITSISGVQLPPVVPATQIASTASGLAYSRVSQTFNGTIAIANVSGNTFSGPFQILFLGVPAGVTLLNATRNLSGTPYLTVPGISSLEPGQSATVNVQFQNPSKAAISFTPVIYSGSIN